MSQQPEIGLVHPPEIMPPKEGGEEPDHRLYLNLKSIRIRGGLW
jgi:hypothetical protein